MRVSYLVLRDGISIQSFADRRTAEAAAKEWEEYHADGRRHVIEERKQPETIRDIEAVCGIASKDRQLTVNGKPFMVQKTGDGINLVEAVA